MSRIGKKVIVVPAGVTVSLKDSVMVVKGAKGELSQKIDDLGVTFTQVKNEINFTRANDDKVLRAKHGLYRALLANMITGVSEGFSKTLQVQGVGFKVAMQGTKCVMNIGFSHPVEVIAPAGITLACPTQTEILVSGIDKAKVGQIAASIRANREPEPYHGYGIHYKGEVIERKEGKTAGKK